MSATKTAKTPREAEDAATFFVQAENKPRERVTDGIERQVLGHGPSIMGVHVWFDEGAVGETHSHHHAQIAYVVSGVFDVMVGDETRTLKAGDSFYVPPHVPHGAVCRQAGELIDVFSPWREDILGLSEDSY